MFSVMTAVVLHKQNLILIVLGGIHIIGCVCTSALIRNKFTDTSTKTNHNVII